MCSCHYSPLKALYMFCGEKYYLMVRLFFSRIIRIEQQYWCFVLVKHHYKSPKCIHLKTHRIKGTESSHMMYEKKYSWFLRKQIADIAVLKYDYNSSLCENPTSCVSIMGFTMIKRKAISQCLEQSRMDHQENP